MRFRPIDKDSLRRVESRQDRTVTYVGKHVIITNVCECEHSHPSITNKKRCGSCSGILLDRYCE